MRLSELNTGEKGVIVKVLGHNTPSYFTKSFKKLFGVLPTQYK